MSDKTNNQPEVSFGLLPVSFRLELIGESRGATAVARSALSTVSGWLKSGSVRVT